ncbi:MAG: cytochrome c oxidase subunit II [Burkholderiaceae bacterium]|nr:cytochrome c oxidase subunit II [Burkholderiaceae bacterium]
MNDFFHFLPEASSVAFRLDVLFWSLIALSAVVALGVSIALVWFSVKYRRGSRADRKDRHRQSLPVELTWTLVPLVVFLAIFGWSFVLFAELHTPPADATTIYVVAKQWMWKAQHPGGQREINVLHVPLGHPVRLTMTSQDVIHDFYVPAFRVKQDVIPGRYTEMWFTPTELGEFPLFCAEFCGLDHSRMTGSIVVMRPAEFADWLDGQRGGEGLAARGALLFRRLGCSGCHGANSSVHAPDLDGLLGRPVHLSDGTTVVADATYIRDSILLPARQVVAGFAPIMPSFAGQVSEEDLLALVSYLASTPSAAANGTTENSHERR